MASLLVGQWPLSPVHSIAVPLAAITSSRCGGGFSLFHQSPCPSFQVRTITPAPSCCPHRHALARSSSLFCPPMASSSLSMSLLPRYTPELPSSASSISPPSLLISLHSPPPPILSAKPLGTVTCFSASQAQVAVTDGMVDSRITERTQIRLGLPSKGRMADDTLALLRVTPLILL